MKLTQKSLLAVVAIVAFGLIAYFVYEPEPVILEEAEVGLATFGPSECLKRKECIEEVALNRDSSLICKINSLEPCACEMLSCHESEVAEKCKEGWSDKGETIKGMRCCHNETSACDPAKQAAIEEREKGLVEVSSGKDKYDVIYEIKKRTDRTPALETYWATVNGQVRSPAAGREKIQHARLDACLGWEDTNALISMGGFTAQTSCKSMCTDKERNEFCRSKGEVDGGEGALGALCQDRCDCAFGLGECENK